MAGREQVAERVSMEETRSEEGLRQSFDITQPEHSAYGQMQDIREGRLPAWMARTPGEERDISPVHEAAADDERVQVLVYRVQPQDTMARMVLALHTAEPMLRRYNRMWVSDPLRARMDIVMPLDDALAARIVEGDVAAPAADMRVWLDFPDRFVHVKFVQVRNLGTCRIGTYPRHLMSYFPPPRRQIRARMVETGGRHSVEIGSLHLKRPANDTPSRNSIGSLIESGIDLVSRWRRQQPDGDLVEL